MSDHRRTGKKREGGEGHCQPRELYWSGSGSGSGAPFFVGPLVRKLDSEVTRRVG